MLARPTDEDIEGLIATAGGVFITGGHDIHPTEYGEEPTELTCNVDQDRDRVELLLLRLAFERRIPILGICRGMQAMNIARGGLLYQDIKTEMQGAIEHQLEYHPDGTLRARDFLAHTVSIEVPSKLFTFTENTELQVNSLHHQGIRKLGEGLRITAKTSDNLPEAVEMDDHPFAVGVQWHPEELRDMATEKLFSAFILAAKSHAELETE